MCKCYDNVQCRFELRLPSYSLILVSILILLDLGAFCVSGLCSEMFWFACHISLFKILNSVCMEVLRFQMQQIISGYCDLNVMCKWNVALSASEVSCCRFQVWYSRWCLKAIESNTHVNDVLRWWDWWSSFDNVIIFFHWSLLPYICEYFWLIC